MKTIVLYFSIFLAPALSLSQSDSTFQLNLGFERNSTGGQLPRDWLQWGSGYKLAIDTLVKNSGKASVRIEPDGKKEANAIGYVAYAIPYGFQAREIELRGTMKLNSITEGAAGLMLRIDGPSDMLLSLDNTLSKNIHGTRDWSVYYIKKRVPENARTIYIGAMMTGKGQLWVDDFQLLIDGKEVYEAKVADQDAAVPYGFKADWDNEFDNSSNISSFELTESKTTDLDILGKVWGYLKYYHPSIAAGNHNWDSELFRILPKILSGKNQFERNSILATWVSGLGKYDKGSNDLTTQEIKVLPDLSWIDSTVLGPELAASLNDLKLAKRTSDHYYLGQTRDRFQNERPYNAMKYPDVGYQLLSLYRYWNIIQYFFPYKYLIDDDWNKVLREYIPKFVRANTELDYKLTVLSLIASIHDTHAKVWEMNDVLETWKGKRYAPLEIRFVENKAVVASYLDKTLGENSGLRVGDVIEVIDNKSVKEIVKEAVPLTPASNYPTQLRDIGIHLLSTNEFTLDVNYRRGTKKMSSQIETFSTKDVNIYAPYQQTDSCFKLINSEIAYLFPGSIRNEYLPKIMEKVQHTRGLIIDLRCYPSDFLVFTLSEYLYPEAKNVAKFSTPSITTPGLFTMTKHVVVGKQNPDYYKGKVVIMINERTQSQAEYTTMVLRQAPRATVIGSTTAAADGDVSPILLPGVRTMISGIGVYYPDGRETQRVGIVPDLEVKPTIKGIREGRDELLEKAISLINEK